MSACQLEKDCQLESQPQEVAIETAVIGNSSIDMPEVARLVGLLDLVLHVTEVR